MKLNAPFEHRSGRVVATLRAVLSCIFLASLLLEPAEIGEPRTASVALLAAYIALAFVIIPVAWRSWWYDQRLAGAMLVADISLFLSAVFVTEGLDADFTSPFLALFSLAVLSSSLRWGWRVAAVTGALVTVLYLTMGFTVITVELPFDVYRFARRGVYMSALLLVLVWFGIDRRGAQTPPLQVNDPGLSRGGGAASPDALRWAALDHACAITGARQGLLAWSDADEPWTELYEVSGHVRGHRRLSPADLPDWQASDQLRLQLFDLPRCRALVRDRRGRPRTVANAAPLALAAHAIIPEGLAVPLDCASGQGIMILSGIQGPGADFLSLGNAIARDIEATIDRATAAHLERRAAVVRTRGAIARDLHDSVAQSLAGACFRLEALRLSASADSAGQAISAEIASVRDALRREQGHVRSLIESLRLAPRASLRQQLDTDLAGALADAAAHWGITGEMVAGSAIEVPGWLSHEVQQLVREAVANAARHGKARRVQVMLHQSDARVVSLDISDDGRGFGDSERSPKPWSISERVASLGGKLTVESSPSGARLAIVLPIAAPPVGPYQELVT